jgi:SanA protein
MWKTFLKWTWRLVQTLFLLGLLVFFLPRIITSIYAMFKVHSLESVPADRVAIVFGAGLRRDGRPTTVLRDRVETAAQLFFDGNVEKLLMSGDNRVVDYNEPEAMRQHARNLGVPDEAIVLDYAGRRTYDTCFRAKAIFGVETAILVTQKFHLSRALFTCNALGLKAVGVEANNYYFLKRSRLYWNVREQFATLGAFWDVYVKKPLPVLGEPEPIFPTASSAGVRLHHAAGTRETTTKKENDYDP